jgi:formate hydrogenlyase subunit 3/multisubunit Na+/H+ antiporter MnhD subunit
MFERDKADTKKSALFYFVMTQMSTTFLLLGFLAVNAVTGSFGMEAVTGISGLFKAGVFLSLFFGFGIKAGVMPFHKWLPYAHSATPSNVSALMSGVMIKVAIYGLVRYLLFVLTPDRWWGVVILLSGVFSAVLGVIYALKEHDIKKLLAYHSIENIGIILMGLGLYLIFNSYGFSSLALLALAGGLFHTLNHALFKSLLFLSAGSVVDETGTRNIEEMGGLIKSMPYTGILFLIGSVSIAALPPFNGFVSELMIFQAFLQSFLVDNPLLKVLLFLALSLFALTSALAAACFVKAFGVIFLAGPRSKEAKEARDVSVFMIAGPAMLAGACVLLGVFSSQLFSSLGLRVPIPNLMVVGLSLVIVLFLVWLLMRLVGNKSVRTSETWGCGIPSQNSSMEYTASGFSEPILTIFRPIYRTNKTVERTYSDGSRSIFKNGAAAIHTFKIFEEKIYLPIARFVQKASDVVSNLHDVDLDTYILYSFAAVVVLILAAGWLIK